MIPKRIVHLLSGGLDSVTLLHKHLADGHHVHCVLVNYGQQHAKELEFAKRHCSATSVLFTELFIPRLGGLDANDWKVPGRNAVLISLACSVAVKAAAEAVTIGCNKDDAEMFPDCRPAFISSMSSACLSGYGVEVCAPFIGLRKWEIADMAKQMGVRDVWWCYRGNDAPCGDCPACAKMEVKV